MKAKWHFLFHRLIVRLHFDRIRLLLRGAPLPCRGPVLFVALHRNGAVDGFVYRAVLPRPTTFLISTQLTRSWFARLFFDGIAVVRKQDAGDRQMNEAALDECLSTLKSGGRLVVFPEGTSSLGPKHLPFKSGAAHLALAALQAGLPLRIVPVGIHYECPWAFRGRVEVVAGEALRTDDLDPHGSPLASIRELKRRITAGLEQTGINVDSPATFDRLHQLARMASADDSHSLFDSLKVWEREVPARVAEAHRRLAHADAGSGGMRRHLGILEPAGSSVLSGAAGLAILGPMVGLAILANLPPFIAATWASRRLPDDTNVILLWKVLVGTPALLLWFGLLLSASLYLHAPTALALYLGITLAGLWSYRSVRRWSVEMVNTMLHRSVAPEAAVLRSTILEALGHGPR